MDQLRSQEMSTKQETAALTVTSPPTTSTRTTTTKHQRRTITRQTTNTMPPVTTNTTTTTKHQQTTTTRVQPITRITTITTQRRILTEESRTQDTRDTLPPDSSAGDAMPKVSKSALRTVTRKLASRTRSLVSLKSEREATYVARLDTSKVS